MTDRHDVALTADLEEAVRLCEVGEYLYSARAYSYGDGYTEPREYGIDWQWQQSKPGECGQGVLLAEAVKWHEMQTADGFVTEAAKLRAALAAPTSPTGAERRLRMSAISELIEHHKKDCCRYQGSGKCSVRRCNVRGGWGLGGRADFSLATCEAHETVVALQALLGKPAGAPR